MSLSHPHEATVIVGGGIAGLAAALLTAQQGGKVSLIESGPVLGGLLGSRARGGWGDFDFGTHVVAETGIPELDQILFPGMREAPEWVNHKHCIQDIFLAGQRKESPFIDGRLLASEIHAQAWEEVKSLPPSPGLHANLEEKAIATYGPTLTEHLFRPVMRKMFGSDLTELAPNAQFLFGLRRLILGTEAETRELKAASPWHDDRLAFHQVTEGASAIMNFYPRERGIGLWIEQVEARLKAAGVAIYTSAKISRVDLDESRSRITSVVLGDGTELPCDRLIWSAPAFHLLKLAGLTTPPGMSPPRHRKALLADLVLDKSLNTRAHYITCYDPSLRTFRVTHYAALQGRSGTAPSKVTLEVLIDEKDDAPVTPGQLLQELMAMDLVPADTQILDSWLDEVGHGFPILTPALNHNTVALAEVVQQNLQNVLLGGRASGRVFFMRDVLVDMHRQLQPTSSSPA